MSFAQVEANIVNITNRATDGQYGPGFQFFIELDTGITISCNGKKETPCGKGPDGKWQAFGVGGRIFAVYTINGQYNNSKSSDIRVINPGNPAAGGGGQQAPQQQYQAPAQGQHQQAPAQQSAPPSGISARDLSIKSGRAVNTAAALFTAGLVTNIKAGLREAIALEVLADKFYGRIYAEEVAKLVNPQAGAAAPQQAPQQQAPQQQAYSAPAGQAPQSVPQQPPAQQAPPIESYNDSPIGSVNGGVNDAPGFDDDIPF